MNSKAKISKQKRRDMRCPKVGNLLTMPVQFGTAPTGLS